MYTKKWLLLVACLFVASCASNGEFVNVHNSQLDDIDANGEIREFSYYDNYDSANNNLWEELAEFSSLTPPENNKIYEDVLARYIGNQNYFERISKNGEPYLYYLVNEVKRRNLPMELALLPAVESDFDAYALSSSGALGMWQFMPATAKYLGMESNWWFESRKDIIYSTDRALDYLEALYDELGDWQLVIAAYNGGVGRVKRAVEANKAKGLSTSYWDLDLPQETREYVPKLLALIEIIKNPWQYGIYLAPIKNEAYFKVIIAEQQISFVEFAEATGVDINELNLLNSGYNHWITHPEKNKFIIVPEDKYTESFLFLKNKIDYPMIMKRHLVKNLSDLQLLENYENFRVINDTNYMQKQLASGNAVIAIISSPKLTETAEIDSYTEDLEAFIKVSLKTSKTKQHNIKQGDTLWSIAREYDVPVKSIQMLNGLEEGESLQLGRKLVVDVKLSKKVIFNAFTPAYNREAVRTINYKNNNHSLADVEKRLGFRKEDLVMWNPGLVGSLGRKEDSIYITVDVNKKNGLL